MKKRLFFILILNFVVYGIFAQNVSTTPSSNPSQIEQILNLSKEIERSPNNIELYISKAEFELSIGSYPDAKSTLLKAIEIDKNNIKVLNLLGLVTYNLYQYSDSALYFKRALSIDKNNQFASYYISIIGKIPSSSLSQSVPPAAAKGDDSKKRREPQTSIYENQNIDFVKKLNDNYLAKKESYDGVDYFVMSTLKKVMVKNDRESEYTIHCFMKVLTDKGLDHFRDFLYFYNSNEYVPSLEKAGTYDENLQFTSVNNKNVMFIDRKEKEYSYVYSDGKYVSFPFPNLKVGSIVEYKINFKPTGKSVRKNFFDSFLFGSSLKTMEAIYIISYDKNLPLKIYKSGNSIREQEILADNNVVSKTFVQKDIEIYDLQGETINIYSVAPFVMVSAYGSWSDLANWYFSKLKEKSVDDPTVINAIIGTIPDFSKKSKLEKINSLFQYMQKNIKYADIGIGESAIFPHTPKEVFDNKFGDCKDQTNLLLSLLKSQGVEAYPMAVSTVENVSVIKEIPALEYFNHMICFVPAQDGVPSPLYLDSTDSYTPFDNMPIRDQGGNGFYLGKDNNYQLVDLPVIPYEQNLFEENYIIKSDEIGSGTLFFEERAFGSFSGIIRSSFQENADNSSAKNIFYEQQKQNYPELKLDGVTVSGFENRSGGVKLNFISDVTKLLEVYFDGKLVIKFNASDMNSIFNFPEATKYDFISNFLFNHKKRVEYIVPDGYVVTANNIKNFTRSNNYIDFTFNADKIAENHFVFTIDVKMKKRIIDRRDIQELIYFIDNVAYLANFELTLENKNLDFEKFYEKLSENYKQKDVYENYIKVLLEKKEYEEALKILDKAIASVDDNSNFYITKASILFELGRYDETEETLAVLKNRNGNDITVYYYYIDLYRKTNNDTMLEKMLLEVFSKFGPEEYITTSLTNLYIQQGDYNRAIDFVKNLLVTNPNNSNYHASLGYIYSLMKDFEKAESSLLESIRLNNRNALAINNLAWLYCENDININKAIEYAKSACELEPKNEAYLDTLAEAYYKNGNYDDAIKTIKEALKLSPHQTYLIQQLDKMEKAKQSAGSKK